MKELKDTLWKAADKLRGSMDASQSKDVILGLVFLKYVSDAFEERRGQIQAELEADGLNEEQIAQLIDDVDEYTGRGVFWVSERARWGYLAENAKGLPAMDGDEPKSIGQLIDETMDLIMADNKSLAATLPRIYNRDNVDQRRLGELLDLFNSARFTGQGASKARDLLGEVPEYFLEKFAKAEGKRAAEFTPPPAWSASWWKSSNLIAAGSTIPAAAPAVCSSRPRSSSRPTTWRARTSPSTARSSTSAPGGWPR
jgi:type I restriction enzyme M protein